MFNPLKPDKQAEKEILKIQFKQIENKLKVVDERFIFIERQLERLFKLNNSILEYLDVEAREIPSTFTLTRRTEKSKL